MNDFLEFIYLKSQGIKQQIQSIFYQIDLREPHCQ